MVSPPRPRTSVPPPCPILGLITLDISDNAAMGLQTARALAAAIEPARHATRLRTLDARRCGMPSSAGDYLADAMRRGAALQNADLRGNTPAGSALGVVVRADDGGGVEHLTAPPEDAEAAAERARRRATAPAVEQPPMYVGVAPPARAGPPRVHVPDEARAAVEAARRAAAARAAAARRAALAAASVSPLAGRRPRTAPARGAEVEALTRQLTSALGALEAAVANASGHPNGAAMPPRSAAAPQRTRSFGRQHSGLTPHSDTQGEPEAWFPWAPAEREGAADADDYADQYDSHAAQTASPERARRRIGSVEAAAYASGYGEFDASGAGGDYDEDGFDDADLGGDAAEGEDSWEDLFPPRRAGAHGSPAAGAASAATDALFRGRSATLGLSADEERAAAAYLREARLERAAHGAGWPETAVEDAQSGRGDHADDDDDVDSLFVRSASGRDDGGDADEGDDTPRRPARAAPPTPRGSEELVAAVAAQLTELCDLRDR